MSMTKTCVRCNVEKPLEEFDVKKSCKLGVRPYCKVCRKAEYDANKEQISARRKEKYVENMKDPEYAAQFKKKCQERYQRNKAKVKKYVQRNRAHINQVRRERYPEDREKLCQLQKDRRQREGEKLRARKKELRQLNLEEARRYEREYSKKRRETDIQFRLVGNLRNRIRLSLENKSECTRDLLGCSLDEFVRHLESQFTPEMNWDNYGNYWEIDHIKPCCSFDLTDVEQQRTCFNWSNCRPLTVTENIRKGTTDKKMKIKQVMSPENGVSHITS